MSTFNVTKRAFARERLTITNGAVVTLTAATYNDASDASPAPNQTGNPRRHATGARIVLDSGSGDAHFSEEGTDPTVSTTTGVGSLVGAADIITLDSYEALTKFKVIALTASNAYGEVVYYR